MADKKRIFATSRIGDPAENRLRERGYELEVFQGPEAPPKKLIIEKVKSGIDGLITTLRDPIDAEIFEAGKGSLKVVAQIAVGFDVAGTDWKLSVADNGIGAPGFAQAKTGLGTSIINALAQQLDARVDVLSEAEGTTVSVTHATFAKLH